MKSDSISITRFIEQDSLLSMLPPAAETIADKSINKAEAMDWKTIASAKRESIINKVPH